MTDDTSLPFAFPAVGRKKVTAAFDGGRITSDGGVMLLAEAEHRPGIAGKLSSPSPAVTRTPTTWTAYGTTRRSSSPAAGCRTAAASCARSRPSHAGRMRPDLRGVIRLGRVMLDLWLASYPTPPAEVILDIDDTCDVVHGHQQLSLFNAHYDQRCFLPIHVYEVATGAGRGDPASRQDAVRQEDPRPSAPALPSHPPPLARNAPHPPRRQPLRSARSDYETLYCARGQAENLIKLHKTQLASDRTSCRSPLANQVRMVLHTAAYWLLLALRDAIPKTHALGTAEFTTLRLRLLKLGARFIEAAARVRLAFAAACPEAALIRHLATCLNAAGP